MSDGVLEARGLDVRFAQRAGLLRRVREELVAVRGVDLVLRRGETLGLVGESGSGKTTLARALLRLVEPSSGRVLYRREPGGEAVDLTTLSPRALRPLRRELQVVFQDPFGSLNPRMTVSEIVGEALVAHGLADREEAARRVSAMLERVGLAPDAGRRYPHEFSGGERQRIAIARALVLDPRVLICDEPTSALDVSVQAQVLELFDRLRREMGLTCLFVSHDLGVVRLLADRVAVLYLGRIVEEGPVEAVFERPAHPYTQALLASRPRAVPGSHRGGSGDVSGGSRAARGANTLVPGEVPSALRPPSGCPFRTRCPRAADACSTTYPDPVPAAPNGPPDHWAACHFVEPPAPDARKDRVEPD